MRHLYVCIMAGGSGERFWPLSRRATPKHLLRLFSERTLMEETVRRVASLVPPEQIFVLTNEAQRHATREALRDFPDVSIFTEPAKRDTAPACALGTALVRSRDVSAVVAFLPADALIKDHVTFARQLREAAEFALESDSFVTFAIKPTHPATGFGYLELGAPLSRSGAQTRFFHVDRFVEKPDEETARGYLKTGKFGWNAGMFLWKSDAFLREAREHQPDLARFIENFPTDPVAATGFIQKEFSSLPKISVDYAIMEKARNVIAAQAEFDWDDVGAWTSLPTHLPQDKAGNTVRGAAAFHEAGNNIVFSDKRLIALCGVNDLVVVETDDAVLVCHRDYAQQLKKLHAQFPEELL